MSYSIEKYISEKEIENAVKELAGLISRDYDGKEILLIGILKGAVVFFCELAKNITIPVGFDFISVSSYGAGTVSSGKVIIKKDIDENIEGRHVLLIDDIIDTGITLKQVSEFFKSRKPASLKICTLFDKPSRRTEKNMEPDYCAFEIPDEFIVGYGLDYDQRHRNLPYVGIVRFNPDGGTASD